MKKALLREEDRLFVEYFKSFAVVGAPLHSLGEILRLKDSDNLKFIVDSLIRLNQSSSVTEENVIEAFLKALEQDFLYKSLLLCMKGQLTLIRKIIRHGGELELSAEDGGSFIILQCIGLLQAFYHHGKIIAVVPKEVCAAYQRITHERLEALDLYIEVRQYADACANFYGVVPLENFAHILLELSRIKFDSEAQLERLLIPTSLRDSFREHNGNLVHVSFEENNFETVDTLLEQTEGKDWYLPPKEELMTYAGEIIVEWSDEMMELADFLELDLMVPEETCDDIVYELSELCVKDAPISGLVQHLLKDGIVTKDEQQMEDLLFLLANLSNNTRKWVNRGFTPNQLQDPSYGSFWRAKVGRNDPCPCGSGKKHKKCCGKADA